MGGGSSKSLYKMTTGTGGNSTLKLDWVAQINSKLVSLKSESFNPISPLGKGKFGHVFLCQHTNSGKHVAIKFIPKEIVAECQCATRLQQEFNALNKIYHPFIVHTFGFYETQMYFAIVMEYCLGGELFTLMKKNSKLPEEHSKFYFCEIALALDYLHNTLNMVYRDLKPENILIDCSGHIKLCDFGFSVPLGTDMSLNDGCGTAMYVAPEIAGGFMKNSHGFPVDWWGLGCVLMEMVTGKAPFGDIGNMSKFEIFNNINEKDISCPISMDNNLKNLLKGLLDKDQNKRFNFTRVKSCMWVATVNWEELYSLKINAPWQPKDNKNPNTSCFMPWEGIIIPKEIPNSDVISYCKVINIPLMKERNITVRASPIPISRKNSSNSSVDNDSPPGNRTRVNSEDLTNSPVTVRLAKQGSIGTLNKQKSIKSSPTVMRKKSISS